jgi:hypothetical protein
MRVSPIRLLLAFSLFVVICTAPPVRAEGNISPFGYLVQDGDVTLAVDAEAARHHGKDPFIPLVVWIGCWAPKALNINRGSFTLTDPEGRTFPMASLPEIQDKTTYGLFKVADDYSFVFNTADFQQIRLNFNGLRLDPGTCFFVNVGKGGPSLLRDDIQLRPNGYTLALLYFPNPSAGAAGPYVLTFTDARNRVSLSVPFTIDWK